MSVVLAARDLRKSFGGAPVLDGVSLNLAAGQVLGIAGPNGAGKTTLFEVLSGYVRADSGTVELMGEDVTDKAAFARARSGLARTFQSPVVPPELTVIDVLATARTAWKPFVDAEEVRSAAALVGLDVPDDAVCDQLGTLDRRRLLLACLLARKPTVVLLDEPCSGLLEDEIEEFVAIARRVVETLSVGMVIIEHRLEILYAIAGRVVVLHEGRQIAEGTPEEAFSDPAVRRAYFEGVAA